IGYYLIASIAPKHQRSDAGKEFRIATKEPVSIKDVNVNPRVLEADFRNMSTKDQPAVIPGFWTMYSFESAVSNRQADKEKHAWYYGEGRDGAAGYKGFLQN